MYKRDLKSMTTKLHGSSIGRNEQMRSKVEVERTFVGGLIVRVQIVYKMIIGFKKSFTFVSHKIHVEEIDCVYGC